MKPTSRNLDFDDGFDDDDERSRFFLAALALRPACPAKSHSLHDDPDRARGVRATGRKQHSGGKGKERRGRVRGRGKGRSVTVCGHGLGQKQNNRTLFYLLTCI